MEESEILNKQIGTKEERTLIKPAKCTIVNVQIKKETKDGKPMLTPLLIVQIKHPETNELLDISKIKCIKKNKVKVVGLWVQLDSEDNINKSSSVALLLDFLKVKTIGEIINKEVDTVEESDNVPYLVIKAY